MTIEFTYNGAPVVAEVIYNFKQIKDAILVTPYNLPVELQEDILLIKNSNQWISLSTLRQSPTTYCNMIKAIEKSFDQLEILNDVLYQRFLS